MKHVLIITLVLISAACQVNFDPADRESNPLPVVYCLLDLNDSIQYVRLSGTFIPEEAGLAEPPYTTETWNEDILIYLEEMKEDQSQQIYFFEPSENDAHQDSGLFQTPSFRLYEARLTPQPETVYRLYVFLNESQLHCFSETRTVGMPRIADPSRIPGRQVSFSAYDDYKVHYYTPANSAFQVAWFSFGDWSFSKSQYGSAQEDGRFITLSSERFFKELHPDADFSYPEFHLLCYGEELAIYNQLEAGAEGLFTPLNFNSIINGTGLFSSKIQVSISNLELSEITRNLISNNFQLTGNRFIDYETSATHGQFSFHFTFPPTVLPEGKVHRTELKLAYNTDSLYKGRFFAEANVSDSREEYIFILPAGDYYYQAGITCSCLADSCLWDGFPNGQYGSKVAVNKITISAGQNTDEKPLFD